MLFHFFQAYLSVEQALLQLGDLRFHFGDLVCTTSKSFVGKECPVKIQYSCAKHHQTDDRAGREFLRETPHPRFDEQVTWKIDVIIV